jgi:alkyl hydroperoxide reductase subunit F
MNFLVISKDVGGQAAWSGDIENYTGYQFITGDDLAKKFQDHIKQYDIELREKEEVRRLSKNGGVFSLESDRGSYTARTVIIATGKQPKTLGIPDEEKYKNKGLTYCATCDAPLFSSKDVAVIGGGNSALEAAIQLIKIAGRIHIINVSDDLTADAILREKVEASEKVEIYNKSTVSSVYGDNFVRGIRIKSGSEQKDIPVRGIFVEIGLLPNSGFARDIDKNKSGEIKVDSHNRTNIEGAFAAGDVTDVHEKQIIIAAGEGSKAALSVFRYLSSSR